MVQRVLEWLRSSEFMPHGHCYFWRPGLVWLNATGDAVIALAYFAIPLTLLTILRRRRDLPFDWIVLCFGLFIVACGATHVLEVWNVWHAAYWLAGAVKVLTALASVVTAYLLARLVPKIVALPSPSVLASANTALAAANQELETFSYTVAHDLRAPLRGIEGFGQALEEDCAESLSIEGRGYVRRLRGEARRMGHLVDGLLNLARLSRARLELGRVDLGALARQAVEDLRKGEPERVVEVSIAPDLVATGDERMLDAVMINLIGNAWKFSGLEPRATIDVGTAGERDGATVYFVRDNGVGFDMAHAAKLSTPFERAHAEGEFPGTGIGLATVRRVVERHGGALWFEAAAGQGATFFFSLPLVPAAIEEAP